MRVTDSAGLSDPGRVRRRNEDSYVCDPPLFAVADGMGGAQAGELASRIAVSAFREAGSAGAADAGARLRSIIQEANRRIYARAARDPEVAGMGTTVTAALLSDDQVAVGHVGDSRAYRIRDGVLDQLTDDHSLVADLVRSGRLSAEEAELHPQRSVITRALGTDPAVEVDSFSIEAKPGDVFLLCSDGLTTMVDEGTLLQAVASGRDLAAAARALIDAANREGGEDNVTVVLFAVGEGDPDEESDEDTLSGLEVPIAAGATLTQAPPVALPTADGRAATQTVVRPTLELPKERRLRRPIVIVAVALLLFVGLAGAGIWGLSRAHFVGADDDGRIVVYQGVPWDVFGGFELYREVYVSPLRAFQLSPEERQKLFDHSLVSEDEARALIAPYEQEAAPAR
jgi:PPM family protein phosphatase